MRATLLLDAEQWAVGREPARDPTPISCATEVVFANSCRNTFAAVHSAAEGHEAPSAPPSQQQPADRRHVYDYK